MRWISSNLMALTDSNANALARAAAWLVLARGGGATAWACVLWQHNHPSSPVAARRGLKLGVRRRQQYGHSPADDGNASGAHVWAMAACASQAHGVLDLFVEMSGGGIEMGKRCHGSVFCHVSAMSIWRNHFWIYLNQAWKFKGIRCNLSFHKNSWMCTKFHECCTHGVR